MLKSLPNIRLLLKRLLLILFIYFLLRLIFFLTNFNYFYPTGFKNILISFLAGLRFDISAIAFTNSLFILLHLIPLKFFFTKKYQTLLKIIFFLTNFNYFSPTGFKNILISFLAGLRFDISAIAFTNSLFILLHLIPLKFFFTKKY